jgi:aspartate/methionine/tyrosine aminotransferase
VHTLFKLKTNLDYGVCMGIQEAGSRALELGEAYREEIRLEYQRRRDLVVPELRAMGLDVSNPGGAMYVWIPIPDGYTDSFDFALKLLEATGVALVPGLTFGKFGERYVRLALVQNQEKLKLAMAKMKEFLAR